METGVHGRVGRTLLGLTGNLPMSHAMSLHSSALVVTAVAMIVVIIAVVAMCVCNQNSSPQLTTITPRKPTIDGIVNHTTPHQVSTNHVTVDIPVDSPLDTQMRTSPNSPDSLSDVNKREGGAARTSATLSRQLPDPPVAKEMGQGSSPGEGHKSGSNDQRLSNTSHSTQADDHLDDYDRLHQPKNSSVEDPSYDHVDQNILANQRASTMSNRENIYATPTGEASDSESGTVTAARTTTTPQGIRENIYAVPNGEPSVESDSGIVGPRNDYTDSSGEDPYAKIDSGNQAFSRHSASIPEKEAANEIYEQPDGEYDPYAVIDSGNKVTPRLSFVAPDNVADSSAAASANTSPPAMAPSSDQQERTSPVFDEDQMYAVVNRPHGRSPHPVGSPPAPALPDRGYGPEEVGILPGSGHLFQVADLSADSGLDNSTDSADRKPEPSYTEVTARESLASMQQRQQSQGVSVGGGAAGPGYDQYPDLPENYYSKVDGSSGDGAFSAQGAVALDCSKPNRNSEMYSEINTSGGNYQTISTVVPIPIGDSVIPEPPPVASLTQLRHQGNQRRQADSGPEHNEDGYALVPQSSKRSGARKDGEAIRNSRSVHESTGFTEVSRVTGPVNRLALNRRSAPLATVESDHDLSIDFGYQSVKDLPELESESDFDPNYETVEDTKKKALKKRNDVPAVNGGASSQVAPVRRHEYEEVTEMKTGQLESAYAVKKRVLQNHCYEDIRELKQEQKLQKKREL